MTVYAAPIDRRQSRRGEPRSRLQRVVARAAYWLLVLAVAMLFVFLLLAFFERRDASEVGAVGAPAQAAFASAWAGASRR